MILIGGTRKSANKLPFSDTIDYVVEVNHQPLKIKLTTQARQESCFAVYLNESLRGDYDLDPIVEAKTVYYKDDVDLVNLLSKNGGTSEPEEVELPIPQAHQVAPVQQVPVAQTPQVYGQPKQNYTPNLITMDIPQVGSLVIEGKDYETPDIIFDGLDLANGYDSKTQQLKLRETRIEKLTEQVQGLQQENKDLYILQERQVKEMSEAHEQALSEANMLINKLKIKAEGLKISSEHKRFLRYSPYAQTPNAVLSEGFLEQEVMRMGTLTSPINIFAHGNGDSVFAMMENIQHFIETNNDAVIVDFSGDYYLRGSFKMGDKSISSLDTANMTKPIEGLAYKINKVDLIPTAFYHSIHLLHLDWATIINRLNKYANGRRIIIILGNIGDFSIAYTANKLSTIGQLDIFVKTNPLIISTLLVQIQYMVEKRFRIVALDYIDSLKEYLTRISSKYSVSAHKNLIQWDKYFQ